MIKARLTDQEWQLIANARASELVQRNEHRPFLDGDIMLDPDTGDIFIRWPKFEYGNEGWETDYRMETKLVTGDYGLIEFTQVGHGTYKRPSAEVRERLVLIGNLFGWGE